jgi:hypothetical protein
LARPKGCEIDCLDFVEGVLELDAGHDRHAHLSQIVIVQTQQNRAIDTRLLE